MIVLKKQESDGGEQIKHSNTPDFGDIPLDDYAQINVELKKNMGRKV